MKSIFIILACAVVALGVFYHNEVYSWLGNKPTTATRNIATQPRKEQAKEPSQVNTPPQTPYNALADHDGIQVAKPMNPNNIRYTQSDSSLANHPASSNPDTTRRIVLNTSLKKTQVSNSAVVRPRVHIIKKGETLEGIAALTSINSKNLARWNCLPYNRFLKVGRSLRLYDDFSIATHKKILQYVVQKGQTLSDIALEFGVSTRALKKINRLHRDRIYAGQTLVVDPYIVVKVKPGVTLERLAKKYNVSVSRLARTNSIKNPNKLFAGSAIKIDVE